MSNDIKQDSLPKVLVVDDNPKNIFAMRVVLEELPVEILEVDSGEQVLQVVAEQELALILMDVQMPGMDGFEVAELLRKNKRTSSIPVIFVTAISKDMKYVQHGHDLGAVDYLFKPIDDSVLKSKVMVFVNYYLQREEMRSLLQKLQTTKLSLEESNVQLQRLARVDSVTGLPNRLHFDEYADNSLRHAKRYNKIMAVLYLDLDNFKRVNDTLGHAKGDDLLRQVSLRITQSVRESDVLHTPNSDTLVSRLGGDEFALVLSELKSTSNAGVIADRILKALNQPYHLDSAEISVGVSIGIACYPHAGETTLSLQKAADIAMYQAKQLGKNNYQFYSDELNQQHRRFLLIETGLKHAIKNNEFSLNYQPIVSLHDAKPHACEALCRWHHAELGQVGPSEFICVAEEVGCMRDIGQWVCEQAIQDFCQHLSGISDDFGVHINLSAKQLDGNDFIDFAAVMLKKYPVDPRRIIFELTETALMDDQIELANQINALYSLGFGISVDDFGTGYSSLSQLKLMPVSSVKLDKMFIDKACEDKNTDIILNSMINLAKNLEIESIAEGVETERQLEFLKQLGCDSVQGFFFAKPMSLTALVDYLMANLR